MAKNTIASNKPLNPLAPPYLKISPTLCYIHTFPQCKLYHHRLQPLISYNVHHFHPPKSFPHPQPCLSTSKVKKHFSVLTPVPWGPRVSRRDHLVNKVVRTQQLKCRLKSAENKATENMIGKKEERQVVRFQGSKRWKNTRGEYHQTLPLESETTSVMIKNIPNKCTRELLILTLDNHCKNENQKLNNSESDSISAYDHLYLPIDFKSRVNAGFAFVNFTNAKAAMKFKEAFHGKRWAFSDSPKVAEISRAKIQGKKAIIKNCKMMDFVCGSDEDLPVLFKPARDGLGRVVSRMLKLGKVY